MTLPPILEEATKARPPDGHHEPGNGDLSSAPRPRQKVNTTPYEANPQRARSFDQLPVQKRGADMPRRSRTEERRRDSGGGHSWDASAADQYRRGYRSRSREKRRGGQAEDDFLRHVGQLNFRNFNPLISNLLLCAKCGLCCNILSGGFFRIYL